MWIDSSLAAISDRPEFLSEISPKIIHTSEGVKLIFNMFYKGRPKVVTIDDKLPFIKPNFVRRLIYARSAQNDNLYLASFFEKAVVKQACFNQYHNSVGIVPKLIFSLLSDCMTSCCYWPKEDSKQNLMDYLKFEVDNKSSVVMIIKPDLIYKPNEVNKNGHVFVVMDYNLEQKAIKFYNPKF